MSEIDDLSSIVRAAGAQFRDHGAMRLRDLHEQRALAKSAPYRTALEEAEYAIASVVAGQLDVLQRIGGEVSTIDQQEGAAIADARKMADLHDRMTATGLDPGSPTLALDIAKARLRVYDWERQVLYFNWARSLVSAAEAIGLAPNDLGEGFLAFFGREAVGEVASHVVPGTGLVIKLAEWFRGRREARRRRFVAADLTLDDLGRLTERCRKWLADNDALEVTLPPRAEAASSPGPTAVAS